MKTDDFKELIQKLQNKELAGFSAQKIYSPPYRKHYSELEIQALKPKIAAVNLLLSLNEEGQIVLPLIKRTTNENDVHSGQISLPGGSYDVGDETTLKTAFRETNEELGVLISDMKLVKALSPLYIPISHFYVFPYVSFAPKELNFVAEVGEVQEILLYPISEIFNLPNAPKTQELPETQGRKVPVFEWENNLIWGATAMILSEFSFLLKND